MILTHTITTIEPNHLGYSQEFDITASVDTEEVDIISIEAVNLKNGRELYRIDLTKFMADFAYYDMMEHYAKNIPWMDLLKDAKGSMKYYNQERDC